MKSFLVRFKSSVQTSSFNIRFSFRWVFKSMTHRMWANEFVPLITNQILAQFSKTVLDIPNKLSYLDFVESIFGTVELLLSNFQFLEDITQTEIQTRAEYLHDSELYFSSSGQIWGRIKWSSSYRWLFGPSSAWSSIETTTIGKTHSILCGQMLGQMRST